MKKLLSLVIALMMTMPIFAASKTMNYQAIINNPDGTPAANREIGMKFNFIADGVTLLTEETSVTSNDQGLVEYAIGSSIAVGLSWIDWSLPEIRLEVWVDLNGGTNYTTVYNSNINSVPTALFALKSGDSDELWNSINKLYGSVGQVAQLAEETQGEVNSHAEAIENLKTHIDNINDRIENSGVGSTEEIEHKITDLENNIELVHSWTNDRFNALFHRLDIHSDSIATLAREIANLGTGSGSLDKAELEAKIEELESLVHKYYNDNNDYIFATKLELRDAIHDNEAAIMYIRSELKDAIASMVTKEDVAAELARVETMLQSLQTYMEAKVAETVYSLEERVNQEVAALHTLTQAMLADTKSMIEAKVDMEVQELKARIESMAKGLIEDYSDLLQNELAKLKDSMTAYVQEYLNGYMGEINNMISMLRSENAELAHEMEWATDQIHSLQFVVNEVKNIAQDNQTQISELQKENADLKANVDMLMNMVNKLQQQVEELSK